MKGGRPYSPESS
jgi:hypothetical protein